MAAEAITGENVSPESEETIDEDYNFSEPENIYEVDRILGVTKHEGKPLYRVRWQGYGPEEDTWEPRENLLTCEDLVEEFIEKQKLRKQKISQNLSKNDKLQKPSKKRTPPKETSTDAYPKRRRSSEKDVSDDNVETNAEPTKSASSSTEDEGPPPLKDPFWDNLEKGLITFDGDMYSKVKSRRATLDAKKASLSLEGLNRDPGERLQERMLSREGWKMKKDLNDDLKDKSTPDSKEDAKMIVKEELCLGDGGMLPEDMYSKVKSRRAFLDAKKLEAAKQELKRSKKAANKEHKSHHHHRHHHHHRKKSKKDGPRKPKTRIDLEAIGSLETATQKTLSMSPSVLERETNAANLFHTPDSCLPMEEVLTVAKLEEKTRNGSYGRQLSGQSAEEQEDGEEKKKVLPSELDVGGRTTSSAQPVCRTSSTDSQTKPHRVQLSPLRSTSHTPPPENSPTFHPSSDLLPAPPLHGGIIIPDTPESPDALPKEACPLAWKPWELTSQSNHNSSSGSTALSVVSSELSTLEQSMMGVSRQKDDLQILGQDLAAKVSLHPGKVTTNTSVTEGVSPDTTNAYNNTAKSFDTFSFSATPVICTINSTKALNATCTSTEAFDAQQTANTAKPFNAALTFNPAKPCNLKSQEPQTPVDVLDKVPAWLELQNFVEKDPMMLGQPSTKSSHGQPQKISDVAQCSDVMLSPVSEPSRGVFDAQHCKGLITENTLASKQQVDANAGKDVKEKKHRYKHASGPTKPSSKLPNKPRKKDHPSKKSLATDDSKKPKKENKPSESAKKKEKSEKTKPKISESKKKKYSVRATVSCDCSALLNEPSLLDEIQELLAQSCPKEGGIEFDFEEDTSIEEPWAKPGLSPIIWSNDALKQAVKEGHTEHVREALWLNGSHDLEQQDPLCGSTLLMHACMNCYDEIAKLLIANGALVNVMQKKSGMTPVMYAAEMGFYNMVAILLEAGAHVNVQQSATGETAMMKASNRGHAQIVNLMLMFGANWAVTTPSANTALEYAILSKQTDVYDTMNNHINRVVMQFESTINQYLCGTARLMKPVFPLQCFRIRESNEHHIYLNHDTRQYSHNQGCGNVLFIGHAYNGLNGLTCRLTGHSFVYKVTLNGQDLPQLSQGSNFLLSFLPRNGRNLITLKTICDPYTKMLLLVGAYSLQIMSDGPDIGL